MCTVTLRAGLGHAQNVLAFQRVPGPGGKSQVRFVGQADCFQAWHQNHAPGCDPKKDARHCNSWDQGERHSIALLVRFEERC